MKHESVIKDLSALSFEAGNITANRRPAITDSRLRLTPVSVRDFNVQPNGSENRDSLGTAKLATTRHWPQKILLICSKDSGFQASVRFQHNVSLHNFLRYAPPLPSATRITPVSGH